MYKKRLVAKALVSLVSVPALHVNLIELLVGYASGLQLVLRESTVVSCARSKLTSILCFLVLTKG